MPPRTRHRRLRQARGGRQQESRAASCSDWKRMLVYIVAITLSVSNLADHGVPLNDFLESNARSVSTLLANSSTLYQTYLTRLITESETSPVNSNSTAVNSTQQPTFGMALIHWRESNVTWPLDVPKNWKLHIYETGGEILIPEGNISRPFQNAGSEECTAYLQYIIDEYDNLPDISVFMQPDALLGFQKEGRLGAHSPFYSVAELHQVTSVRIQRAVKLNQLHQRPAGGFVHYGDPWIRDGVFETSVAYDQFLLKDGLTYLFDLFGLPYDKVNNSTMLQTRPSACFGVTRDRILKHAKEQYQLLQQKVYQMGSGACYALENSWHVVFGEPNRLPVESSLDDYYFKYLDKNTYQRKDTMGGNQSITGNASVPETVEPSPN